MNLLQAFETSAQIPQGDLPTPEIKHRIAIAAPAATVFEALSTIGGLANSWTETTSGTSEVGGVIDFRFGEHVSSMRVERLLPDRRVEWQCVASHPDWVGTRVSFELEEEGGKTQVAFSHADWRESERFFAHCSTKWAVFLVNLKQLVESGAGRPFPRDIQI